MLMRGCGNDPSLNLTPESEQHILVMIEAFMWDTDTHMWFCEDKLYGPLSSLFCFHKRRLIEKVYLALKPLWAGIY